MEQAPKVDQQVFEELAFALRLSLGRVRVEELPSPAQEHWGQVADWLDARDRVAQTVKGNASRLSLSDFPLTGEQLHALQRAVDRAVQRRPNGVTPVHPAEQGVDAVPEDRAGQVGGDEGDEEGRLVASVSSKGTWENSRDTLRSPLVSTTQRRHEVRREERRHQRDMQNPPATSRSRVHRGLQRLHVSSAALVIIITTLVLLNLVALIAPQKIATEVLVGINVSALAVALLLGIILYWIVRQHQQLIHRISSPLFFA